MAPSVEYSKVAITKGATDENRHQTTQDGFGRIELLAATIVFPQPVSSLPPVSHCNPCELLNLAK